MKILILLSSEFPYGKGESYLESEFSYLKTAFKTIYILPTYILNRNLDCRSVSGANLMHYPKISPLNQFYYFVKVLFSFLLYQEFYHLFFYLKLKLTFGRFKTIFRSLMNAFIMKDTLKEIVIENRSYEVLIYSYWNDDSALAAGLIKKQFPAIKFVSRAHGWDFYFYRNLYGYLPFKWFIYNSLDCFYLISYQAKNYLQTNWKIKNTQKVKLARLGVFPIPNKSFINTQTFTIVSVASLIPLKRINLIVEALALIRNVELKWIHFGDGPMFDVIQQKAKNLFSNQIHFEMRGHISQQALYHFYQSESVQMFINVSQYEGLPVSIMEAFAAAIPAIATDVGAVSEIVNEENGFLLNVDFEPKELADIILKCCSQPQLLKSKSTYALATWKQYYNAEVNYKLFADSLLSL